MAGFSDWTQDNTIGQVGAKLDGGGGGGAVDSVFGRTGVITAQAGDYNASEVAFAPGGGIIATEVQAAIVEVNGNAGAAASAASAAQSTANAAIPTSTKNQANGVIGLDGSSNAVIVGNATAAKIISGPGSLSAPAVISTLSTDTGRCYPIATAIVDLVQGSAPGTQVEAIRYAGGALASQFAQTTFPFYSRQPVANVTAASIPLAISSGSGQCYTNTGTTAKNVITFPASGTSPAGTCIEAIVTDADGIRFLCNANQQISDGGTTGTLGGNIESTSIGSSICLLMVTATDIRVKWKQGTWVLT